MMSSASRSGIHALAQISAVNALALAAAFFSSVIRAGNMASFSRVSFISDGTGLLEAAVQIARWDPEYSYSIKVEAALSFIRISVPR